MSNKPTSDAATVARYLAKLEGHYIPGIREAKSLEELRELMAYFVLEHYQHELDMAALRLAGLDASRDQRLEAAEAI
ncbi:MAG: hypothetical protein QUS09_01455, partial [Methanotrichaceae archaeon]|nr:hypothetical protein [Methanotrichaceae archaeon]